MYIDLGTILFYGIPLAAIIYFIYALRKYDRAQKNGASEEELKEAKYIFRLATIILVCLLIVVFGFIGLLFGAISFM